MYLRKFIKRRLRGFREWTRSLSKQSLTVIVLISWLVVFTAGLTVDSRPYRLQFSPQLARQSSMQQAMAPPRTSTFELTMLQMQWNDPRALRLSAQPVALQKPDIGLIRGILYFAIIFVSYTPPNVGLLSVIAASAGSLGRQMTKHDGRDTIDSQADQPVIDFQGRPAAAIRGLFVYIFLLSGIAVFTGDPLITQVSGPDEYIRIAGLASAVAFIAGWNPEFIKSIAERIGNVIGGSTQTTSSHMEGSPAARRENH